jgi:Flp pilus assembly pilin Flp
MKNSIVKNHEELLQTEKSQKGQGMTEYLAATALIGIAAIGTLGAMGDVIQSQFSSMTQELSGASGADQNKRAVDRGIAAKDFDGETGLHNFSETKASRVGGTAAK